MTVDEFTEKMKLKASEGLLQVSGQGKLFKREWDFQNGSAEIITIRGGAIEKASILHLKLKSISESGVSGEILHEVYQMEVFPDNPYCPMGHFNTELYIEEPHRFSMNLDLFPAVRVEEDLRSMKTAMDAVADQFGRDREEMRKRLDEQYTMEHFPNPLAAMVGCKLPELKDEDFELFVTAYETFLDMYLDILIQRKGYAYIESEMQVKLLRNGKWLQYLTLKDRAFRGAIESGIPQEMLINLASRRRQDFRPDIRKAFPPRKLFCELFRIFERTNTSNISIGLSLMKEIRITAEGSEIIEGLLSQSPLIIRDEWRNKILRMVTLLMLENGSLEADKKLVLEAARFVTSPEYHPFFDMFDNIDKYKKSMSLWYYDDAAYYAAKRAVKRWESTVTKPKKPPSEMKVLAINASPRRSGNTQMLINQAVDGMRNSGVSEIEHLFLQSMNIRYCLGCRKCKDPGNKKICVIEDDMTEIYDKIIHSDAFIIGLPVFSAREPAQLITFLNRLDSFRRFDEAKDGVVPTRILEPGLRRAMVIGTWGYPNTDIYDHIIAHVANVLYMQRIEPMEMISACGFSGKFHGYDDNHKAIILRYPDEMQKVYEAGKTLVSGIK